MKASATATDQTRADEWVLHFERSVLGAILLENDLLRGAASELQPFHFLITDHRQIMQTARELQEKQIPFDVEVLAAALAQRDRRLKTADPRSYLEDLTDGVVLGDDHIQHLSRTIVNAWRKRELRRLAERLEEEATKPGTEPEQICQLIEAGLARIDARPRLSEASEGPLAPVLDEAALYGLAGKIVKVIALRSEADTATLLLHFLTAYGNVIGRSAYCQVESTRHYTNLYYGCIGETSKGRKGTAWGRIYALVEMVAPVWCHNRIQGGLSSGEGLIAAVADQDQEPTDRRLMVVQGELASAFKCMERDGNTLSPVMREAWDSGFLNTMTKHHAQRVKDAHISVIGHMTRTELQRKLDATETANGWANRFLWAWSVRSKCLPEGGNVSREQMQELADELRLAINHGSKSELMVRDDEARELWAQIYPALSEGQPGLFGAVTSRAEAQVLRLSMLFALLDCSGKISVSHLKAAQAVWNYCAATARFVFGNALGDPVADSIWNALREAGANGLTRTQISADLFGRNRSSKEILRALEFLLHKGLAHPETVIDTGGRSSELWKLGPRHERGGDTVQ